MEEGVAPMEDRITAFIANDLVSKPELLPIKNDTPLIESGILDSLGLLKLLVFLEEQFAIEVDNFDFVLENFNTVDTICNYVRSYQR